MRRVRTYNRPASSGVCKSGGLECRDEYDRRAYAIKEPGRLRTSSLIPPLDVPEEWRPVVGYEGRYEVSDQGRIKGMVRYQDGRVRRERLLKCTLNAKGYPVISLRKDERKAISRKMHRLVARAFLGPCPEGMVVRHGLGGPGDASLANLCYGTPQQNHADIAHHREILRSSGIGHLTDADVLEIHRTWLNGELPARVAEEYVAVIGHASKVVEREKRSAMRRATSAGAPTSPHPPVAERMLAVVYQAPETQMTA